ncbi:MAG: hypothetical protein LBM69_04240 [Lachnospiraceae bacterium]|jgi:hypothetical protein|nr:hypothetical protein [Lachnospiraceae bacterium]
MSELCTQAWKGFLAYTQSGKYAVLFLCVLLYWWFGVSQRSQKGNIFATYATLTAIGVIFPPTAVGFMIYQTPFYNYRWIFGLVPITAMIAGGAVAFYTPYRFSKESIAKIALYVCMGAAMVVLCGTAGRVRTQAVDDALLSENAQETRVLVDELRKAGDTETICLLAPQEIMEWVRIIDSQITMPYGRNLWQPETNGYSYDVVREGADELYAWMVQACKDDVVWEEKSAYEALTIAITLGMNRLLLPDTIGEEFAEHIRDFYCELFDEQDGCTFSAPKGYYLFVIHK